MVSKDYRTGLNHYHGYIGSYWVPTPTTLAGATATAAAVVVGK